MTDSYLNSEQAADLLGCSVSQISNLVRSRRLKAAPVGRGYTFRRIWLDDFLEREAQRFDAELAAASSQPAAAKPTSTRLPDLSRYG